MITLPKTRYILVLLAALATLALLTTFALPRLLGEKITVLAASRGELRQSVVASGKVRSPQRVELASQITGRVTQIPVREGQSVAAGQLLIQLDDAEWRATLAQAKASQQQSELRLAQMQQLTQPLATQAKRQAEANLLQAQHELLSLKFPRLVVTQ